MDWQQLLDRIEQYDVHLFTLAGANITVSSALKLVVLLIALLWIASWMRRWTVERALTQDDLLECFAGDVLHHDEKHPVLLFRREHRDDVRVIHRGEEPWLLQHLGEIEVLLVRNLDCDLLVDPGVFGEEDAAKAAALGDADHDGDSH